MKCTMKILGCAAFLPLMLLLCSGSPVEAQITTADLIGSAVETVDARYREVDDALVLFQRGNGQAALSLLRESRKKHPELPPGEVMFAHLCFASGNPKPGREILQAVVVNMPDDPEAWNMLADLQLREDHLAEAEVLFRKAIDVAEAYQGNAKRKNQLLSSAYAGASLANERRGLWKEAEPFLRAWLQLMPENQEIYSRLAVVLMNTERFSESLALLEQLRERNPMLPPAEVVLAIALEQSGKLDQATDFMKSALEKHPKDFTAQVSAARLALHTGDFDQALRCAIAASELDKDSYTPQLIMGQVEYLRGDFAKAEERFQFVYQSKPGNFDAMNGLASTLLAQGEASKYKLALEYAELIAKGNNDLRTLQGRQAASLLAWGLYRNERFDDAERLMTSLLASGPVNSETAYFAAAIYHHQGKEALAQEALAKALSQATPFAYSAAAEQLQKSLKTPAAEK